MKVKGMKLFEKFKLGSITLRNRIVMPPMATLFGNRDGTVSSLQIAYYGRRSRGGAGLIIVENTAIHPEGVNYIGTLEIHSERFEEGLSRLASAIKTNGAVAAIQLFHPGRQIHPKYAGNIPVAPSPVPCPVMGGDPKALDPQEIKKLVRFFVDGAIRARDVGFDAVEIHGAHGYLVAQFLSPISNRRNDRYGGDPGRRARFAVEIVEGIRERMGDSFPVIMRISADEKVKGGLTLEQTREIIPYLVRAGISALHVSAGCYPSMEWVVQPYLQPRGLLTVLAKGIRDVTDLPIITVGRINDPLLAESILQNGDADLISMGRALIADPDLPEKAKKGRFEEIRPCIACNECISRMGIGKTRCTVNPEMGKEDISLSQVNQPKRVLVVGGGPAGIEAATRAASLGHTVKLVEAENEIGGQLIPAGVPGSKGEIRKFLDYQRYMLRQSKVQVELGRPFDTTMAYEFHPDYILLATGAIPKELQVTKPETSKATLKAIEVLKKRLILHGDVVVVGGGPVGLDVAEFLSSNGARIHVLEMKRRAGDGLEWNTRKMKLKALEEMGVQIFVNATVIRIEDSFVAFKDSDGKEKSIHADFVIEATGSDPFNPFEGKLNEMGFHVRSIGDCKESRGLAEAISDAFKTVMDLSFPNISG